MHNKNIIFLTFFCISNTLIGMKSETSNIPIPVWYLTKTVTDDQGISSKHIDLPKKIFATKLNLKTIDITDPTTNTTTSFSHNCWVTVAAISSSGNLIATGSGNNKARLFNRKKNKQITIFELNSSVSALDFDPSEQTLAIASHDNKVHIFNLKIYEKHATLDHDKNVVSICFSSSGNTLATETSGSTISIFAKS